MFFFEITFLMTKQTFVVEHYVFPQGETWFGEGRGRFGRSQEPTKTSKREVGTLPKRYPEQTRKLMVFQKTE